jgi:hypothetical protein
LRELKSQCSLPYYSLAPERKPTSLLIPFRVVEKKKVISDN